MWIKQKAKNRAGDPVTRFVWHEPEPVQEPAVKTLPISYSGGQEVKAPESEPVQEPAVKKRRRK